MPDFSLMTPRAPRALMAAVVAALLAGCTVGPDFRQPELSMEEAYARQAAKAASTAVPDADVEFWRTLDDPLLIQLVQDTLDANHDIRIGLARYEQAQALTRNRRLDRFPTVGASAEFADQRVSAAQAPGVSRADRDREMHAAGLSLSWELDFFGRVRRGIEAQQADMRADEADLAAIQVAMVAQVTDAYFQLRGLQEQKRVAQENEANQARTLSLIETMLDNGRGTAFDTDRGRTQLALTQSRLPALDSQAAVMTHRIAVLTGRTPAALAALLDPPAALPALSMEINAGAPGELLRRRPDIAAAEHRLAASTARIGVATGDLFPRFTLGGLLGTQALGLGALFDRDSETRQISLGIGGSFLDVGRVRSRIAASNAAAAADLAAYERTVLLALEETENALVRLAHSQDEHALLEQAAQASRRAASTARLQFEAGMLNALDLLEAERFRLEAEDRRVQTAMQKASAWVAVYRTLAGGWPQHLPSPQGEAYAEAMRR